MYPLSNIGTSFCSAVWWLCRLGVVYMSYSRRDNAENFGSRKADICFGLCSLSDLVVVMQGCWILKERHIALGSNLAFGSLKADFFAFTRCLCNAGVLDTQGETMERLSFAIGRSLGSLKPLVWFSF